MLVYLQGGKPVTLYETDILKININLKINKKAIKTLKYGHFLSDKYTHNIYQNFLLPGFFPTES